MLKLLVIVFIIKLYARNKVFKHSFNQFLICPKDWFQCSRISRSSACNFGITYKLWKQKDAGWRVVSQKDVFLQNVLPRDVITAKKYFSDSTIKWWKRLLFVRRLVVIFFSNRFSKFSNCASKLKQIRHVKSVYCSYVQFFRNPLRIPKYLNFFH